MSKAEERLRSSVDKAREALDPNDLWVRRKGDPVKVSLPGEPMKCVAAAARGTRECRNWAVLGSNVCRNHGGAAPRVKAAAARRLLEVRTFQELFQRVEHAAEVDPLDALMTEVARSSVITEGLSMLVGDLGLADEDGDGAAIIAGGNQHPLVRWLNEERDRKVRFAEVAVRAGVAERYMKIQERQIALMAQVVSATLDDPELGLDENQRTTARHVLGRHLRALPSAS